MVIGKLYVFTASNQLPSLSCTLASSLQASSSHAALGSQRAPYGGLSAISHVTAAAVPKSKELHHRFPTDQPAPTNIALLLLAVTTSDSSFSLPG